MKMHRAFALAAAAGALAATLGGPGAAFAADGPSEVSMDKCATGGGYVYYPKFGGDTICRTGQYDGIMIGSVGEPNDPNAPSGSDSPGFTQEQLDHGAWA
ncbi:hypothetical protein [Streptomyces sp. NPDC059142]|uniref:hypothetical protein n=1 Tax=Streptomyces sp. NPDC059142 TaxID=3346739 RepID=UPI00369EDAFD